MLYSKFSLSLNSVCFADIPAEVAKQTAGTGGSVSNGRCFVSSRAQRPTLTKRRSL